MFKVQTVIIDITSKCPLNCIGCFIPKNKVDMSIDTFNEVIKKLPKVKTITLSGGEPFLHKDLLEFCKIAKEKKCNIGILTSGNVEVELKPFKEYVDKIFVTIKYPIKQLDGWWRKNSYSLINSKNFLNKCKIYGIPAGINWCVDKKNMYYASEMVELAEKYNAKLQVLRFIPNDISEEKYGISDFKWNTLCKSLYNKENVEISFPWKGEYNCHAAINRIGIRHNGDIKPCIYSEDIIGNLIEESWKTIDKKLKDWRWERKGKKGCLILEKKSFAEKMKMWFLK